MVIGKLNYCPVCYSSNVIYEHAGKYKIKGTHKEGTCEDCGFLLIEPERDSFTPALTSCIICGNKIFYIKGLIRKRYVCYLCETEYKTIESGNVDLKFSENTNQSSQKADIKKSWELRINKHIEENYNSNSDC